MDDAERMRLEALPGMTLGEAMAAAPHEDLYQRPDGSYVPMGRKLTAEELRATPPVTADDEAEDLREALDVLRLVEWQGGWRDARDEGDGWVLTCTCPCCESTVIQGHAPDCRLARLLEPR